MRGKGKGVLDPAIVPLDLALEVPLLGQVNGCGAHSAMFSIRDDSLHELFSGGGWSGFGCWDRFSLGGRSRNARPSNGAGRRSRGTGSGSRGAGRCHGGTGRGARDIHSGSGRYTGGAGRRTTTWFRSQRGGLFAPIGQRVLMLLETGHDSAPARLHSRAQLLCIVCARGANRSKCRLIIGQRGLRRCGGADNEQYPQTLHNKPRLKVPIKQSRSA